jgi:hypothetical protein
MALGTGIRTTGATALALVLALSPFAPARADELSRNEARALTLCHNPPADIPAMIDSIRMTSMRPAGAEPAQVALVAVAAAGMVQNPDDPMAGVQGVLAALAAGFADGTVTLFHLGSITGPTRMAVDTSGGGARCIIAYGRPVTDADLALADPSLPAPRQSPGPLGLTLTYPDTGLTALIPDAAVLAPLGLPPMGAILYFAPVSPVEGG